MEETIFYKNIMCDIEKSKLLKEGINNHLIQPFDQGLLTRLRKIYWACFNGLLYLYYMPTIDSTIGNKIQILTYMFEDEEYEIVHGKTYSCDKYMETIEDEHQMLDYNSWIEVKTGNRVWVYDTFSMLKIDKNLYCKLENPIISRRIPKDFVVNHMARDDDYSSPNSLFLLFELEVEEKLKTHPYRNFLIREYNRYKEEIGYDNLFNEFLYEEQIFEEWKKHN